MRSYATFALIDFEIYVLGYVVNVIVRFFKIGLRVSELQDPENGLSH